jgi:exonuclease VII large subunit
MYENQEEKFYRMRRVLAQLDPSVVMKRGYALIRGKQAVGETLEIETYSAIIKAKVEHYDEK